MRYSATLVEHFLNPRNAGLMRNADGTGSEEYDAKLCAHTTVP